MNRLYPSSLPARSRVPDAATVAVVGASPSERWRLGALAGEIGCTVLEAASPEAARRLAATGSVDLVILHCAALVGEGLAVCRALSGAQRPPLVLIVAETADLVDEILALELGADDLILGTATDRLVLARLKALLRRAPPRQPVVQSRRDRPGWRLNPTTRAATSPGGRTAVLSPSDASVFHLFLENPGVVLTGETGARALRITPPTAAAFRTAVCRLRKKLGALGDGEPILTVRGVGYVSALSPPGRADAEEILGEDGMAA